LTRLHTFEWLTVGYLAYLNIVVWLLPLGLRSRRLVVLIGVSTVVVVLVSTTSTASAALFFRNWILPPIYLLVAYWLSGLLFTRPMEKVERWLLRIDRLLRVPQVAASMPRVLDEYFEAAYLIVYPMIPIGFAVLNLTTAAPDVDRFWSIVMLSDFICFGMLPWIQTRPPRAIEEASVAAACRMRHVNLYLLERTSIHVNTVPSGHAAEAFAVPLALAATGASGVPAFFAIGVSIAIATVVGRYHYVVDTVAGVMVAVVAWIIFS
jgi:hypothetical protein